MQSPTPSQTSSETCASCAHGRWLVPGGVFRLSARFQGLQGFKVSELTFLVAIRASGSIIRGHGKPSKRDPRADQGSVEIRPDRKRPCRNLETLPLLQH